MSSWLSDEEMKSVVLAEKAAFRSPVPTQVVSNGEFVLNPASFRSHLCVGALKNACFP